MRLRFILTLILLISLGIFFVGGTAGLKASSSNQSFNSDNLLVKFKPEVSPRLALDIHKQNNGHLDRVIPKINVHIVKVAQGEVEESIARYSKNPNVLYAEPDYLVTALATTNDPQLSQQWGMFKIEAANSTNQSAWDITTGSSTVKIAILDTGIEMSHEDLASKIVLSQNFTTSPTVNDRNGHGTHVAGIAAAITNNNLGVAGVGYNSSLMNVKVLGDNGSGYYSWVANGIIWATDNGAKVINMSLGGSSPSQTLLDAVNYAWEKGVVLTAAAGNKDSNSPIYPAYYEKVIAVAATDSNDQKASWSTWGSWVDVAAPGVSIHSTYKKNTYASYSGTSMASPHTAGLAGLVWATDLCLTNSCVRSQIENNADAISGTGVFWTYGRINAFKAVGGTPPPPPPPPPPPVYYTLTVSKDGTGSGTVTSNPSGINCGATCSAEFSEGTSVTLSALANSDSAFVGWSGACTGTEPTCLVLMNSNLAVTATFNLLPSPPPPPPTPNLQVTVTTDKTEYRHGERAQITVRVTDDASPTNPVGNADVNLTITTANNNKLIASGLTDSSGIARFTYRVNASRDGVGTYKIDATASKSGYNSGSGSTTFLVKK